MFCWRAFYVRHVRIFFFVLSTSILIAKVILNKENTIEAMKNIKDMRVYYEKLRAVLRPFSLLHQTIGYEIILELYLWYDGWRMSSFAQARKIIYDDFLDDLLLYLSSKYKSIILAITINKDEKRRLYVTKSAKSAKNLKTQCTRMNDLPGNCREIGL